MWQVDNDKYCLWRLEHELNVKRMDRLLNSVTCADRQESLRPFAIRPGALAAAIVERLGRLHRQFAAALAAWRVSE
jgi:hypothetical protein